MQISTSKTAYGYFGKEWITFKESSTVNRKGVTYVAMSTVTYQNGRKFTLNPVYFPNY